jgi:hypothetical protein
MNGAQPGRTAAIPGAMANETLIAGRFAVDLSRPLPGAGGGLPAFAAIDRSGARDDLMALQVHPDAPPRAAVLAAAFENVAGLLAPLAHGPAPGPGGRAAWFVICPAPAGPALWPAAQATIPPWDEAELLRCLIAPAAAALEALRARGLTHRAIRPDNLFRAGGGERVVLGNFAAAPPALLQPAAFEPPYVAMCLPAGRGDGSVADDVYALGVVALALALGRMPWAGMGEEELIRRKLELGSYAALGQEARLPPGLGELLRAMLAEDPAHRPPPALLIEPAAARSRRVAARPLRRAQRAITVGGVVAWDARMLAYAIARDPAAGVRVLRGGIADHWLRRILDDAGLAARLEELTRHRQADVATEEGRADAMLALRAVALLDPLAPLCWQGVALWPDGFGPALVAQAESEGGLVELLGEMIVAEATVAFAAQRLPPTEQGRVRQLARTQRAHWQRRGWAGGMARLRYALNPLLPCRSPALGGALVARIGELLPALETAMAAARLPGGLRLDGELIAFIAAQQENGLEPLLAGFGDGLPTERVAVAQVRLLAKLQASLGAGRLPHLATALAEAARPALDIWRSRSRREAKQAQMTEAAATGDLSALLAVLDDPTAREADAAGLRQAIAAVSRIDAELAALAAGAPGREAAARAFGREIAAGLGLAALAASGVAAALG